MFGFREKVKIIFTSSEESNCTKEAAQVSDYPITKPGEEKPNFEFRDHPIKPTKLWNKPGGIKPTNKWHQNLTIGDGAQPICLYPYQIKLTNTGFNLCHPNLVATKGYVISPFVNDFIFNFTPTKIDRRLTRYDDFSATMEYSDYNKTKMTCHFFRGCPYLTFELTNAQLLFDTIHAILSFSTEGLTNTVTFNNGQTWLIFTTQPVSWSHTLSKIVGNESKSSYTGILRIALVQQPYQQNKAILEQFSTSYPISGEISYDFPNDKEAFLHFNFQKKGSQIPLLLMCLPHHKDCIVNLSQVNLTGYKTIKGPLTAIIGDQWTLHEKLNKIQWSSPTPINQALYPRLLEALCKDVELEIDNRIKDPYFFAKSLAKIARLALVAEQLNRHDLVQKVLVKVKRYVEPWLSGTNENKFIYDQTWGGIITSNGLNDLQADFGNGYYNDHHFHYGYFVYAIAIIGKYDPGWVNWWRNPIFALVRDFANTKDDQYFLKFRVKDFYDGHSWASGLFEFGDSKNQESTSESINAYYALYLLALSMKDQQLINIYNLMLTTELRSCKKYWHMTTEDCVYDNSFAMNKTVGILWTSKVDYATWFGANAEFIHCIQMLPFLPISHNLLEPNWIKEAYPVLEHSLTRSDPAISGGWKTFVFMALAVIDKNKALNLFANCQQEMDDGNTLTNTFYWFATQ